MAYMHFVGRDYEAPLPVSAGDVFKPNDGRADDAGGQPHYRAQRESAPFERV
jgi:hypothetical protein